MNTNIKQKWVYENGVYYPIPGDTTLHSSPGNGVFQIYEQRSINNVRLGIRKIAEKFEFGHKIYDLGAEDIMTRIESTWNSPIYKGSNHNLGVIFNGLKGTGKTIAAKILSNRLGIPVLVVPASYNGILEFISSLCFEAVILIDEAEKTFSETSDVLLKLIDGVYNEARKLYVLTTNRLTIDENLLGRPGRIRYIKEFGNLEVGALMEYINDNLIDKSKIAEVIQQVDLLEISTIDILKAIIDEVNIHGQITDNSYLNIPKASYRMEILHIYNLVNENYEDVRDYIISQLRDGETVAEWYQRKVSDVSEGFLTTEILLDDKLECTYFCSKVPINSPRIIPGVETQMGEALSEPDQYGFFLTSDRNNKRKTLQCLLSEVDSPSLYRGTLQNGLLRKD